MTSLISGLPALSTRRPKRNHGTLIQMALRSLDAALGGDVRVVQVGANDGKMADPIYAQVSGGKWSGLLLEPHPDYFADLQETYRGFDKVTCRNIGVSEQAGAMMLYHLREDQDRGYPDWLRGCASLSRDRLAAELRTASKRTGIAIQDDDIQATEISLQRLDAILAEEGFDTFDVLTIDVEGHELPVLRSFDIASTGVSVAIVECKGANKPQEAEYVAAIEAAGLQVFRVGADLLGVRPENVRLPLSDVMRWIGYAPLGAADDATATE